MLSQKNIAFTSFIKVHGRLREFNFRKRGPSQYDVDTNDEKDNRYFFKMLKQEEGWNFSGADLPGWLMESESLITTALEKKMKRFTIKEKQISTAHLAKIAANRSTNCQTR